MEKQKTLSEHMVEFFGFNALLILIILWRACVFMELWRWFVVPTFGLAALRLLTAAGLSSIVALFNPRIRVQKEKDDTSAFASFALAALYNALVLGIGYLIHLAQGV